MNGPRISRRVALGAAIATGAATAISAKVAPSDRWDRVVDVIVVGFGVAGACAAYEAVRAGAKVLVIDNGGASANASHGHYFYFGGGTAMQKAHGVHDTPDAMFRYLIASVGPEPDEKRIEAYVAESKASFDWLVALGIPFTSDSSKNLLRFSGSENSWPWRDLAPPAPRGHIPTIPGGQTPVGGGGAMVQQRIYKLLRAQGIEFIETDGRRLVQNAAGMVTGIAIAPDNQEIAIGARRGVVLATGGFANNTAMVSQHAPLYARCQPSDVGLNDGWGIRAGQSVGAALRRMGSASATWLLYPPESRKAGILVNKRGQRFVAEDSYSGVIGDAIVREQNGSAYLIVDQRTMADGPGRFGDTIAGTAQTIAELERILDLPAPALQQSVDSYNLWARRGEDPLLHKAKANLRPIEVAPFTAIKASVDDMMPFFTLGGLHTTPAAEVLNAEGQVIPGLFAAGRTSAGIAAPFYYSSGLSLGECVIFGRAAGVSAAKSRLWS